MPRTPTRARGLYKNGSRWWLRVKAPTSGAVVPRSTGTDDLRLANRVAGMIGTLTENRPLWDLLEQAAAGELDLATLYNHHAAGTLHELRATRAAEQAAASDADLRPWVEKFIEEGLAVREISVKTRADYTNQLREFIPADKPFPASRWTEDVLKSILHGLTYRGRPLSGSTRRRKTAPLLLFHKWARRRVPLTTNPFEDAESWVPANNSPRALVWEYATTRQVLANMTGEARVAMTLVLGSGIELGALLALRGADVKKGELREIVAHGTKNEAREERRVMVDAWAWPELEAHARLLMPTAPVFTLDAKELRDQFYAAQVAAGVTTAPARSVNGKLLWKAVNPHRIHDARHTYAVTRMLGDDGEKRQPLKMVQHQLGHASEQMLMNVYGKCNVESRLREIELREAKQEGRREAK